MPQRASAAKRGYGPKWRAARAEWLRAHPHCVFCSCRVKPHASRTDPALGIVDHKIPHKGDLKLFWDRKNWQTLCNGCHNGAKQHLEHSGELRVRAGCDRDGIPLDAGHHWR